MHGAGTVGPVLNNHAGAHAEEYGQIGKNQHAGELFHDGVQRLRKSIHHDVQTDVAVVANGRLLKSKPCAKKKLYECMT